MLMVGHFVDFSTFLSKLFIVIFYQEFKSKSDVLDIFLNLLFISVSHDCIYKVLLLLID